MNIVEPTPEMARAASVHYAHRMAPYLAIGRDCGDLRIGDQLAARDLLLKAGFAPNITDKCLGLAIELAGRNAPKPAKTYAA